ncbi:MAG TPA: hypothetical protein VIL30_06095 [Ramlibacter sp.]|jgi:hypothetical protein
MAKKFSLIGKTKVKLTNITPLAVKKGQKDLTPAVAIRVKYRAPSTALDMFDPALRGFLFEKNGNPQKQTTLEGVPAVSQLSQAGVSLGAFNWGYEQTGCVFTIHRGATGDMNVKLSDATVKKVKFTPHEGDAVDIEFTVHAADIDAEIMGDVGILKQHEVECELELPEPPQKQLATGADEPQGQQMTPLTALAGGKAAGKAGGAAARH